MTSVNRPANNFLTLYSPGPNDPVYVNGSGSIFGGASWARVSDGSNYPSRPRKPRNVYSEGFGKDYRPPASPISRRKQDLHPYTNNGSRCTIGFHPGFKAWDTGFGEKEPAKYYPSIVGSGTWNMAYSCGSDPWTANDELALIAKLRERILGSDFNLSVFIGEGHQTLKMIADAATTLGKAFLAAKNGNFKKSFQALHGYARRRGRTMKKKGASSWLELQYGWLPLLSDVRGGAEYLNRLMGDPVFRVTASRRCRNFSGFVNAKGSAVRYYAYGNWGCDFAVKTGMRSKKITAYLKSVDELSAAGITDPRSVAWELVPFSFVVDWFLPVGTYLEGLNTARSLKATYCISSRWYVKASKPTAVWSKYPNTLKVRAYSGNAVTWEGWNFSRTITTSLNIPLPEAKPLEAVASLAHCINAVALLTVLSSGKK